MKRSSISAAIVLLGMAWGTNPAHAAEFSATEIVTKAHDVAGGDDSISRLTFTFQKPDGAEKKLIYTMVWKEYGGKDDIDDKVIFFSDYPPDDKGKSFMTWVYGNKKADEWMYLPELRMVRKVTHSEHHHHDNEEDDFAHSVLTHIDLVPREPGLDDHALVHEGVAEGVYLVESIPKQVSKDFTYQKTRRWISKDHFLLERIDYYGKSGEVEKRQTTKWKKIGEAWVWEQVVGEDLKTKARTVLDISDIRLNNDLKDEVFSARTLRLGKDSIAQ